MVFILSSITGVNRQFSIVIEYLPGYKRIIIKMATKSDVIVVLSFSFSREGNYLSAFSLGRATMARSSQSGLCQLYFL